MVKPTKKKVRPSHLYDAKPVVSPKMKNKRSEHKKNNDLKNSGLNVACQHENVIPLFQPMLRVL